MGRVLIVGYGNPLRGDDAVGYRAADLLRELTFEGTQVETTAAIELGPELAETLACVDLAIFIDASVEGEPGTVRVRHIDPAEDQEGTCAHDFRAGALLALAKLLYGHVPRAAMLTVTGSKFDICSELSPQVEAALPELEKRVSELIRLYEGRWRGACGPGALGPLCYAS